VSRELSVLIPVLRRPHRIRPVAEAFRRSTPACEVVFGVDEDDIETRREIQKLESSIKEVVFAVVDGRRVGYASKINLLCRYAFRPLLFFGADDLNPQPGWFSQAHWRMERYSDLQVATATFRWLV